MSLMLLNVLTSVSGQCRYSHDIMLGSQYYIFNEEYPENYRKGTNCRWSARSEPGTQIVLTCEEINIPQSNECQYDKLSVSLSGNANFADAHNYCGEGTLSLLSNDNSMEIGLFSSYWSPFRETGRFICSLTSIRSNVPTTTTRRPVTCDCGWKQGMRIVGGQETGVNEYPFMSALVDSELGSLYCGAAIISQRYAVTAAHCLTSKLPKNIGLLVGDHNISTGADTPYAQIYLTERFIIHPEFNPQTQNNDIAMVKTRMNIAFSLYVGPVCLPFRYTTNDFRGLPVTALGWGSEEFSGPRSEVLQEVTLNVISNQQCSYTEKNITDKQLCTYASNKDSCQSDSGGPLVYLESSIRRLQLVGVISFGLGCATLRPSVNVRVTSFLSWIVSQTSDTNYCIR
ncbi:venom serine protease-like isoform X2 [Coccinella septempunctata]|nr:venom serine protease-like isoform X2 [Coccinella septempunctata]